MGCFGNWTWRMIPKPHSCLCLGHAFRKAQQYKEHKWVVTLPLGPLTQFPDHLIKWQVYFNESHACPDTRPPDPELEKGSFV